MSSTAAQVKSIILKHNGRVSKQQIARELKLGLEYVGLICCELKRKEEIAFRRGVYSLITLEHKPLPALLREALPAGPKRRPRGLSLSLRPRNEASKRGKQKKLILNVSAKSVWSAIPKMTKELGNIVERAGYKTIESLAEAPIVRLMQETKLKLHEAAGLINQARKILNKIDE